MSVPRTFVFVDLSGFTNYTAAYGDDAAGRILGTFRTIVRSVASERGVRIAKWLVSNYPFSQRASSRERSASVQSLSPLDV
jgi:hypothetical protein